jgi:invasin D
VHSGFSLTQLLDRSMKAMNRNLENMNRLSSPTGKVIDGPATDGAAQQVMAEVAEQVEGKRIRWQMWSQQVRQCGSVMNHCMATLPPEQRQKLEVEQERIERDLLRSLVPPVIEDDYSTILTSSNDFFDKLLELIDLIKTGYLDGYSHILNAYSVFFGDFNNEITAMMKNWIKGVDDGKKVELNAFAFKAALSDLIDKYTYPNAASILFPEPDKGGASKAEAEKWLEALGLPVTCLKHNADGSYYVVIDTGPLWRMRAVLPSGGTVTWDTARFQAWQTGFNAQEEGMKNTLQSFTQKYSNANSYHDNFNKTLSSHLNQYADMLKAMLNF